MDDEPQGKGPIGALVWMIGFLVVLVLAWMNVYLRLWY